MKGIIRRIVLRWQSYRYRFVPWIALNIKKRTVRSVTDAKLDKVIADDVIKEAYLTLFTALNQGPEKQDQSNITTDKYRNILDDSNKKKQVVISDSENERKTFVSSSDDRRKENLKGIHTTDDQSALSTLHSTLSTSTSSPAHLFRGDETSELDLGTHINLGYGCGMLQSRSLQYQPPASSSGSESDCNSPYTLKRTYKTSRTRCNNDDDDDDDDNINGGEEDSGVCDDPTSVMHRVLGYAVERRPSEIEGGGTGVFVTRGTVPKGKVVVMYPGTIYYPSEPILFQSIGNPFVFRCLDGVHVDGNDKKLSKMIYRSCAQRDRLGPYLFCDLTWLTPHTSNPLAVGQYVNNQHKGAAANVCYQEFNVPPDFPYKLRKYLPNNFYSTVPDVGNLGRNLRTIALVSLREIHCDEELLSSYFTLVH